MSMLRAIVAREAGVVAELVELSHEELPPGDVTIAVSHSSLNHKDALAVSAAGPIVRSFPMVCGIDLAGVVQASDSPSWPPGAEVIATGWGLSESHPGGYTQLQRVRSEWLTARPQAFTLAECMAIGTAGLTAMLCVLALQRAGVEPGEAPVLVTGAGGGVGSLAVCLLAGMGFKVAASTGREELHEHLRSLGASEIVARGELDQPGRPLGSERWAGAVDSVGGQTLANVLAQTRYGGAVAACGLAGGAELPATVLPFILRNVSLLGIDSVLCPAAQREAAWRRLACDLPASRLAQIATHEPLGRVPELAAQMLVGRIRGRVVIDTAAV
ncbi:MAG TPA: MDR family oxidoreductase [Solirubrobacteraceae bacterium]|nr:MDR family oxidoreductase [Solirubrobacteraceae bacterium]